MDFNKRKCFNLNRFFKLKYFKTGVKINLIEKGSGLTEFRGKFSGNDVEPTVILSFFIIKAIS